MAAGGSAAEQSPEFRELQANGAASSEISVKLMAVNYSVCFTGSDCFVLFVLNINILV